MSSSSSSVRTKAFEAWLNWTVSQIKYRQLQVKDLFKDLRNGLVVITCLEVFAGKKARNYCVAPSSQEDSLRNVHIALKALSSKVSIDVSAQDIVQGDHDATLALVWKLVSFSLAGIEHGEKAAQRQLLNWVCKEVSSYGLAPGNFASAWQDGRVLCCLVDAVHRTTFSGQSAEYDVKHLMEPVADMNKALATLRTKFDLPQMLSAQQIYEEPEGRCVMLLAHAIRTAGSEIALRQNKTADAAATKAPQAQAPQQLPSRPVQEQKKKDPTMPAAATQGKKSTSPTLFSPTTSVETADVEDDDDPSHLFFSPTSDKKHRFTGPTQQHFKSQPDTETSSFTDDSGSKTGSAEPADVKTNAKPAASEPTSSLEEQSTNRCVLFDCQTGIKSGYLCPRHLNEEDKIRGNRGLLPNYPNILFKLAETSKRKVDSGKLVVYYHFEVMAFRRGEPPVVGAYEARFSDFDNLRKRITTEYKANSKWAHVVKDLPEFPSKPLKLFTDHFSADFLEKRSRQLQEWLLRLAAVLYMSESSEFLAFSGLAITKGAKDSEHSWQSAQGFLPKSDKLPARVIKSLIESETP
eukprot:gb/GEZN01004475.1/.p1 GENE.gb/GEZN01004475.1/~~gb/GEZN01004475.1/.p1  ORF type:complete len:589 (+),score=101.15 gb/GEZN01004475.1/:39-1769(+)